MKKLMVLIAILSVGFANAQRGERTSTPEQMASLQSKKMTLALDLDNKQQAQVEKLLLSHAKDRVANKMSKEDRADLTEAQKVARKEAMLTKQITMKREMKKILNEYQYTRWEKMMAKRGRDKRKGGKDRRNRDR